MHKHRLFAAAVSIASLLFPGEAHADSDGYFCVGPGYLAYELRWVPGEPHLLKLVRFGDGEVQDAGQVELQDFQAHDLICEEGTVRISGWASGYISYTIDVSAPDGPTVTNKTEDPSMETYPRRYREEPPNLGRWSRPGLIELESPDADHTYQLEINWTGRELNPSGLEHRVVSTVVVLDRDSAELGRLVLFDGTHREGIPPPAG